MSSPKEQASCSNDEKGVVEGEASQSSLVQDPPITMDDEDTIELIPDDTEQAMSEEHQPTELTSSYDISEELSGTKITKPARRESESAILSLKKKRYYFLIGGILFSYC